MVNYSILLNLLNLPDEPTGKTNGSVMESKIIKFYVSKIETNVSQYFTIKCNDGSSGNKLAQITSSESENIRQIQEKIIDLLSNWAHIKVKEGEYGYELSFTFNHVYSIIGKARFDGETRKFFQRLEYLKLEKPLSDDDIKLFFRAVNVMETFQS